MYDLIIEAFQKNKGANDFSLCLGYLSGMSEVYGKTINSGRDGETFTDEEKERLKSFGDDELSGYADNPVVSRKKLKNPYRPDSGTNRLIRYTEISFKWHPYNVGSFIAEKKTENESIKSYIDGNLDLVAQYQTLHKGFEEKYIRYIQEDGNRGKTINDYIYYLLTEARGFERREGFESISDTPFKAKGGKYILNTYIRKDEVEYFTDKSRYFVVSIDGKGIKEICGEQASYVSELFRSPDTPKKNTAGESELERYAKTLRGERSGIWCDYLLDQMVSLKLEIKKDEGNDEHYVFSNQPIVRVSKAVENKTSSKPEIVTESGLFSKMISKSEK